MFMGVRILVEIIDRLCTLNVDFIILVVVIEWGTMLW